MRIATFTQTPFVSHDDKNMVYIRVEDWDMCNPYEIQLFLNDRLVCKQRVLRRLSLYSSLVPNRKSDAVLIIKPFEDLPVEAAFTLSPPRHW